MKDNNTPYDPMTRCYIPESLLERLDAIAPKYIQGERNKSARARWAIEEYLELVVDAS